MVIPQCVLPTTVLSSFGIQILYFCPIYRLLWFLFSSKGGFNSLFLKIYSHSITAYRDMDFQSYIHREIHTWLRSKY